MARLHLHRRPALIRRQSQQELESLLIRLNLIMCGWANYHKYAVAVNRFAPLHNLVSWRLIRMLQARHRCVDDA